MNFKDFEKLQLKNAIKNNYEGGLPFFVDFSGPFLVLFRKM